MSLVYLRAYLRHLNNLYYGAVRLFESTRNSHLFVNHTVEPPTQWANLIDQFYLAINAKENLDIDNLKELF